MYIVELKNKISKNIVFKRLPSYIQTSLLKLIYKHFVKRDWFLEFVDSRESIIEILSQELGNEVYFGNSKSISNKPNCIIFQYDCFVVELDKASLYFSIYNIQNYNKFVEGYFFGMYGPEEEKIKFQNTAEDIVTYSMDTLFYKYFIKNN